MARATEVLKICWWFGSYIRYCCSHQPSHLPINSHKTFVYTFMFHTIYSGIADSAYGHVLAPLSPTVES